MASYFQLTLDTTGASNPSIVINGGTTYISTQLTDLTIGTSDSSTTGYQMKIWGDVDTAYDINVQSSEATSQWITYVTSKQIKLSSTDGNKVIYIKIRDDVRNESSIVSDSIYLDMTLPVVTITGADVTRISKQSGRNVASFNFTVSEIFAEYKVKVVTAVDSLENTGTLIPITAGSVNMSGVAGNYPANTPINCQINGTDLQIASSGDGVKIIKVFAKDPSGKWST